MFVTFVLTFILTASAQFPQFGNFSFPQTLPPLGTSPFINPFFLGENMQPGPLGMMSNSLFQFPIGTTIQLQDPATFYGPRDPNAMVYVGLDSLPENRSWMSAFSDKDLYMSVRDLKSSSSGKSGSRNRRLTAPVKAVLQKPALFTPPLQSQTQAGTCQKADCIDKRKKSEAQLVAVKNKILAGGLVPKDAFLKAWNFLYNNWDKFENKKHMVVVDYRIHGTKDRFFLINLESGKVEPHRVTHALNSSGGGDNWGYPVKYSNKAKTNLSSYGLFSTGSVCEAFTQCLRVNGLQAGINDNAGTRGIYIHNFTVKGYDDPTTKGCFGLDDSVAKSVIDRIQNKALMYVEPCIDQTCPAFRNTKI